MISKWQSCLFFFSSMEPFLGHYSKSKITKGKLLSWNMGIREHLSWSAVRASYDLFVCEFRHSQNARKFRERFKRWTVDTYVAFGKKAKIVSRFAYILMQATLAHFNNELPQLKQNSIYILDHWLCDLDLWSTSSSDVYLSCI